MARAKFTVKLQFEFYTLDDIHDLALKLNLAHAVKDSWRSIAIDVGARAEQLHRDLRSANEALANVNEFADNWAEAFHQAEGKIESLKKEELERVYDLVLDINHWRNRTLAAEQDADGWVDTWLEAVDTATALESQLTNQATTIMTLQDQVDDSERAEANLTHEKDQVVEALRPWWDAADETPEQREEAHDELVLALPDWLVNRLG